MERYIANTDDPEKRDEEEVKMSYRCDECNQTTGPGQKLLKRIVYRTVLHKEGVQGQQIANEIKLCPDCMKAQPTGSPKPITQSTEHNQKVWIFLRTIRHLKGTKGVQLAKDFARKYLTLDQAHAIFPNLDFSDADFAVQEEQTA